MICLSYKGKGDRNLEDLHDFVFRMPVLEYRNKTWSNLDLALRLKKDVIKALISHTGAIIGNKFSHHRASKQQQSRLREMAASAALIANSDTLVNTPSASETASVYSYSVNGDPSDSPTLSFASANPRSPLMRSGSFASSLNNASVQQSGSTPPSGETMSTFRPSVSTSIPRPPCYHQTDVCETQIHGGLLQSALGRHFTNDAAKPRLPRDGDGEESDPESHRKKSVLLLGKKILGSLS